jgi:hypothetical protein
MKFWIILKAIILFILMCPFCLYADDTIKKVLEKNGNIFVQYVDATVKQLTIEGTDSEPCMAKSKNFAVFVRKPKGSQKDKSIKETQIVLIDLKDRKEQVIVQGCTYEGEKNAIDYANSKEYPFPSLCELNHPVFSNDDQKVYFQTAAWVTSGAIHYYSFDTGKIAFFSDGEIRKITQDGNVIVTRTGVTPKVGRYLQDWLLRDEGKVIRPIGEKKY